MSNDRLASKAELFCLGGIVIEAAVQRAVLCVASAVPVEEVVGWAVVVGTEKYYEEAD